MHKLRNRIAVVVAAALLATAVPSAASITRVSGPTNLLTETLGMERFDLAFDTTNRVYLMVWGTLVNGPVKGLFLNEAGAAVGPVFVISGASLQSGWARAYYSAADGKFIVSYTKIISSSADHQKAARFVAYSGGKGVLGTELILDQWRGGAGTESGIAYSSKSGGRFFVTWWKWAPNPVSYVAMITPDEQVTGPYQLSNATDGQSDPEIACDMGNNRCLVVGYAWGVLAGGNPSAWARYIDATTGAPQGDPFYLASWPRQLLDETVAFSEPTGSFVVGYIRDAMAMGQIVNSSGSVGSPYVIRQTSAATVAYDGGGYSFLNMAYNPGTRTILMSAVTWNGLPAAQEVDSNGLPIAGSADFVPNDGGAGLANPWEYRSKHATPAANPRANEFLLIDNHYFKVFRVSRYSAGAACSLSLPSSSASYGQGGGSQTLTVTASNAECQWTSASNVPWITITAGANRTGTGTVSYSVAANMTTSARSGTMTIAGQTFTVTQAGVPCNFSINPATINILSGEANGTINVIANLPEGVTGNCSWSAWSGTPSIAFPRGASGTNSGQLPFDVSGNYRTVARTQTAIVAGHTFTMNQTAAPFDAAMQARENGRSDFDGDGNNDLLWQDTTNGYLAMWSLQGGHAVWTPRSYEYQLLDTNWRVVGTGDFNGDGNPDIVWHHRLTGAMYLWYMKGLTRIGGSAFSFAGEGDTRWKIVGVGDFNGDRKPDLVWQHDTGWLTIFLMNNTTLIESRDVTPNRVLDPRWRIAGVADLNTDGNSDLVFMHSATGELGGWIMNGATRTKFMPFSTGRILDMNWRLAAVLDVNGDQAPDFIWHNAAQGGISVWYMNGTERLDGRVFNWKSGPTWTIVGPK